MRYFLSKSKMIKTVMLTVLCVSSFVACTTVELDFGSDFIPDKDKMKVEQITINGLKTYNILRDSIPTNNSAYVGSMITPNFGAIDMNVITTYVPGVFKNQDSLWGDEPKIDSVVLEFIVSSHIGDSLGSSSKIMVKTLENALPFPKNLDSIYYSNFDAKPYVSQEILGEFNIHGTKYRERVNLPIAFAEKFLDTTGRIFNIDSLFIKKFPGLYFEAVHAFSRGVVNKLDLNSTAIRVYYHNKNKPNADTTSVDFITISTTKNLNQHFTMINHRYELSDPIVGINPATINDTINPQKKIYIEALSGVMGQVEFPKEAINDLIESAKAKGFSKIVVNNATINFNINVPSTVNLDNAFNKLGLMYNFNTTDYIKDYYPFDEQLIAQGQTAKTPNFGGAINRALNNYQMDITSYVQSLLNGKERYKIQVAPSYGNEMLFNGVILDGGNVDNSCEVLITYTLLK